MQPVCYVYVLRVQIKPFSVAISKISWNKPGTDREKSFWKWIPQIDEIRSWVSLFRQEATKYRHVFLPTIIKEIQTGPFTESTD